MEWLFSLAILPIVVCGLMCAVPMVLAAVGLRRRTAQRGCRENEDAHADAVSERQRAESASR